jgi:hypothetical protein
VNVSICIPQNWARYPSLARENTTSEAALAAATSGVELVWRCRSYWFVVRQIGTSLSKHPYRLRLIGLHGKYKLSAAAITEFGAAENMSAS